jgi:hypothetical protein
MPPARHPPQAWRFAHLRPAPVYVSWLAVAMVGWSHCTLDCPASTITRQNLPVWADFQYIGSPALMGSLPPSGRTGRNCSGSVSPVPPWSGCRWGWVSGECLGAGSNTDPAKPVGFQRWSPPGSRGTAHLGAVHEAGGAVHAACAEARREVVGHVGGERGSCGIRRIRALPSNNALPLLSASPPSALPAALPGGAGGKASKLGPVPGPVLTVVLSTSGWPASPVFTNGVLLYAKPLPV